MRQAPAHSPCPGPVPTNAQTRPAAVLKDQKHPRTISFAFCICCEIFPKTGGGSIEGKNRTGPAACGPRRHAPMCGAPSQAQEACLATPEADAVIQFQSQTHAWRCVMLHRTGTFFPEGCGSEVRVHGGLGVPGEPPCVLRGPMARFDGVPHSFTCWYWCVPKFMAAWRAGGQSNAAQPAHPHPPPPGCGGGTQDGLCRALPGGAQRREKDPCKI